MINWVWSLSPHSWEQVAHPHPHHLALGYGSPLDAFWCPCSPTTRLLLCVFTFWGVCNVVRADSEPTGLLPSWHETAATCCLTHGPRAPRRFLVFLQQHWWNQAKTGVALPVPCSGSCPGTELFPRSHLGIALQRASWDISTCFWQTRISSIIRTTSLKASSSRKVMKIAFQKTLSTSNAPKNIWLCILGLNGS